MLALGTSGSLQELDSAGEIGPRDLSTLHQHVRTVFRIRKLFFEPLTKETVDTYALFFQLGPLFSSRSPGWV
jgi:hypothetical protein